MRTVFLQEIKLNFKSFLIGSLSVGLMGLACILLYQSMEGDMKDMADAFSNMGAFSDAFGMSTLSIATLTGYFATEVGTVHGLGSAMFAAILAIDILSKEEEKHTGEFLLSLPVSRTKVAVAKGSCVLTFLALFTVVCGFCYCFGFWYLDEEVPVKEMCIFLLMQFLMNLEIAGVCFCISAASSKSRMGVGLGLTLMFYVYDLMGRVVPDLADYLFVGPYSYANASEIFSGEDFVTNGILVAVVIIIISIYAALFTYQRRDLAG